MKKLLFFFTATILLALSGQAFAAPITYSDELPAEYIQKYRTSQKLDYRQAMPLSNVENSLEVKVYSPNSISLGWVNEKIDNQWYMYMKNGVNDKVKFIVAEDVKKNGVVYIRKGTEAIGLIRVAQVGFGQFTAPDEIQISMFNTKDVNGKNVKLYGTVLQEGKELGIFAWIGAPTCPASIPKSKIYTLYAEK